MSNAELYDYLLKTNPEFARIYSKESNVIQNYGEKTSFDSSIKAEEGGVFSKAWAWVAKKSTQAKDTQDNFLNKAMSAGKKIFILSALAIFVFILIKFNLLKDIKKFLRSF